MGHTPAAFKARPSGAVLGLEMSELTTGSPTHSKDTIAHACVSMAETPPSTFVKSVIRWLTTVSQLTLQDLEMASRVRIAVAELTENVVKYGRVGSARVDISLEQRRGQLYLRIETRNSAPQRDIERAVELLSELRSSQDPVAYYDQLIKSVAPTFEPGVSGLGLARIRVEGELDIDFRVDGDVLTLSVETPIGSRDIVPPSQP